MLKVCQRPELIQQLQHGLEFATDEQVNNDILLKYSLWDYLTPCDADNENILNACIARWRDEANQLYQTTLLQYDPLKNVTMREDIKDERRPDLEDTYSPEDTTTTAEAGYDVPRTMYDAVKTTRGGKDVTTRKGKENYERGRDLTGSDGRYTQQQLVEMQRKLVLDCLSWYVDKFAQCFNVSMSISDYECCEMDLPPCEGMPPVSSAVSKLDMIDNELGALARDLEDCCTHMSEELDALKKSSRDSKDLLAGAITDKGVPTAGTDTFQTMADNIAAIPTGPDWVKVADWDFTTDLTDSISGLTCDLGSYTTQDSEGIHFTQNTTSRCRIPYQNTTFPDFNVMPRTCMAIEFDVAAEGFTNSGRTTLMAFGNQGNCIMHYNVNAPAGATRWIMRFDNQGVDTNIADEDLSGKTVRVEMFAENASNWLTYYFYVDGVFKTSVKSPYSYTPNASWICLGPYSSGGSYRGMQGGIVTGMRIFIIKN